MNEMRCIKCGCVSEAPLCVEHFYEEFEKQTSGDRSKMLNYFMKKRLKNLMEHLNEF